MSDKFDLVVIGAGPGGYVAAIKAAQAGLSVAVVESRQAGGTCLNRGCIPTKSLLHSAELYREIQGSALFGIETAGLHYDIEKIYSRKDAVITQLREGVEGLLKSNKIQLIHGSARIDSPTHVTVTSKGESSTLETDKILIATGSVPAMPPIPGLDLPGVISSDELLQNATDYKSLVIIGGGVIGVEFATVFSSLGCQVTIIEALPRILPNMDREISQNLSMILKKRGVTIHANAMVEKVVEDPNGLSCHFSSKDKANSAEAQAVLVAIGRRANTEGLFSSDLELKVDRGIVVDENFCTSLPGVYAIGDVVSGGIQLAHVASAQGCCAVSHMLGNPPEIKLDTVPSCIYTTPEIACVGLTADEAKGHGLAVKTGKYVMTGNGKSIIENQERGFIKVVFDAESDVLVGAQLMCARATDIVSELSTAITAGLTVHQLASVIRPHPTFTEGVTEAVEDVLGTAVHIAPKLKR